MLIVMPTADSFTFLNVHPSISAFAPLFSMTSTAPATSATSTGVSLGNSLPTANSFTFPNPSPSTGVTTAAVNSGLASASASKGISFPAFGAPFLAFGPKIVI